MFACPKCGNVGMPTCPACGQRMIGAAAGGMLGQGAPQPQAAVGGQFQCPACGATGLPNWDANGTPTCPVCGTRMGVR
jgi:predicted RNA-binding Zn-ribbon protein involved in translation (DUF1610 family)